METTNIFTGKYPLFFKEIIGSTHPEIFMAYVVFAFLGAIMIMLIRATRQAAKSEPFTYKMLNLKHVLKVILHLLVSIAAMLIYIRFSPDLIGMPASSGIAFLIGFCNDLLITGLDMAYQKFGSVVKKVSPGEPNDNSNTPGNAG